VGIHSPNEASFGEFDPERLNYGMSLSIHINLANFNANIMSIKKNRTEDHSFPPVIMYISARQGVMW